MAICLPTEDPTGYDYEDFVASVLRALGYFIETRVRLRGDTKEVLELDVVATPSGERFRERLLVEAKNSRCSFSDMFKVFGQRTYLAIDEGRLVHSKSIDLPYRPDYEKVGTETGVHPVHIDISDGGEIDTDPLAPQCTDPGDELLGILAGQGWYHLIGQRLAYAAFNEKRREHPDVGLLEGARRYGYATERAFFEPGPLARARMLYEAYMDAPGITDECVRWASREEGRGREEIWEDVRDTCRYSWIQYVLLLEHKARNAIIKNALDEQLRREDVGEEADGGILVSGTPGSFNTGMEHLTENPYYLRIPYLLQVFVETLGGFLAYSNDEELALVEATTGVPASEVVDTLLLMDQFFPPASGSWFITAKDELMIMKNVPGIAHGAGAFIRQSIYGAEGVDRVFPEMAWLIRKWHSALYTHLDPELRAEE